MNQNQSYVYIMINQDPTVLIEDCFGKQRSMKTLLEIASQ